MNKINIKTSDEFHNSVKSTLDNIVNEQNVYPANSLKKSMSIAASIVLLIVISLFTASAAGLIDLHKVFIKRMDIEDDADTKQLAALISSPELPETIVNGGYTLKLLHSANDAHNGIAMFELSSNENNLHPDMYIPDLNVAVDGIQIDGYSVSARDEKGIVSRLNLDDSIKQTINDLKEAETEWNSFKDKSNEDPDLEALSELAKHRKEFNKNYTTKFYFNLYFNSIENINGKNISLDIKGFELHEPGEEGEVYSDEYDAAPIDYYINDKFSIGYKLANGVQERTINFSTPVKIENFEFKAMSLNPLSMTLTPIKPLYKIKTGSNEYGTYEEIDVETPEEQQAFQNLMNIGLYAVKYKNGKTERIYILESTNPNCILSTFDRIIDFNNVQSIFIGNPINSDVAISEDNGSIEVIIQENKLIEIPIQ